MQKSGVFVGGFQKWKAVVACECPNFVFPWLGISFVFVILYVFVSFVKCVWTKHDYMYFIKV